MAFIHRTIVSRESAAKKYVRMLWCSALKENLRKTLSSGAQGLILYDGSKIEPSNFSSSGPATSTLENANQTRSLT
jgi:hypothetical protein